MSETDNPEESVDLEQLLAQKEQLEGIIRDKFTKVVTVVFTDLKGSTSIAEKHGDLSTRALIRDHNNIVFPIIKENNGVLVKSMGDGTLSYFDDALDAVRAGAAIQIGFGNYNKTKAINEPVYIRVGMHTGSAIIEKNDIFGDVVNTASRFESSAQASEIQLSETTYDALSDKDEIPCRFVRETTLKGKSKPFKIYKAYWDPEELEKELSKELMEQESAAPEISEETIVVGKPAGGADPAPQQGSSLPSGATQSADFMPSGDEAGVLQQVETFKSENELIQLFSLLNKHGSMASVRPLLSEMTAEMKKTSPRQTLFFGEKASWYFKPTITIGRVQNTDFPVTNKAMSRVPITFSIRDGEGFIRVRATETDKLNLVEIESDGNKQEVHANTEYSLGQSGRVIFSSCFPVEYKIYKDRFMVLRFQVSEECIKTVMNLTLPDVWRNFEAEAANLIILGV